MIRRHLALLVAACTFFVTTTPGCAATPRPDVVRDGQANAEIVIGQDPPRAARLAANELQTYLEKISGAELPIVHEPSDETQVQIYVGESPHAEAVGVTDDGLNHGAYRITSGDNWLALIGHDQDFAPIEPWARHHGQWAGGGKRDAWDELSGGLWRNPLAHKTYRYYSDELDLWRHDRGGSLNAVYGLLRDLGVRWYMPGELGEIVPQQASIALPRVDKTVEPDVKVRFLNFNRYSLAKPSHLLWARRLGYYEIYSILAHGLRYITER